MSVFINEGTTFNAINPLACKTEEKKYQAFETLVSLKMGDTCHKTDIGRSSPNEVS